MYRICVFSLLLLVSTAHAATREDKIRELMEVQGVLQMIEQQIDAGKEEARKQVKQVADQVMDKLSPPADQQKAFKKAFDDYTLATSAPWAAKEIVTVWAKAYGSRFTDAELDGLLAYYKSPLGRKDVKASQDALPELTDHFTKRIGPILEKETGIYLDKLDAMAKACKCPRK